jgi:hypothetical protein
MIGLRRRESRTGRAAKARQIATVYCCTACEGPGTSLEELRESCRSFAKEHDMVISAWAAEVTPDDLDLRYTSLLRYAIDYANNPETDLLLIAESGTLARSAGAAAFLAKALSPTDSRIVVVPTGRVPTQRDTANRDAPQG